MECFVAGVKVAEISERDGRRRTRHAHERRSVRYCRRCDGLRFLGPREKAPSISDEGGRQGLAPRRLSVGDCLYPSPDDNSIMPSGLEGIITQKLDALSQRYYFCQIGKVGVRPPCFKEALRTCFPGPKDSGNDDAIDELVKAQLIVADSHGTDTQNTRAAQRLAGVKGYLPRAGDLGGKRVRWRSGPQTTGTTSGAWLVMI